MSKPTIGPSERRGSRNHEFVMAGAMIESDHLLRAIRLSPIFDREGQYGTVFANGGRLGEVEMPLLRRHSAMAALRRRYSRVPRRTRSMLFAQDAFGAIFETLASDASARLAGLSFSERRWTSRSFQH
jgi:hypothetical protein